MRDMNIGGGGNHVRVIRLCRDTRKRMERDDSDRGEREKREREGETREGREKETEREKYMIKREMK